MYCPYRAVIEAQVDMPVVGAITLYVSLLTFTLRVHPDRLDYVDQVLVEALFELIKGLIGDMDETQDDEVSIGFTLFQLFSKCHVCFPWSHCFNLFQTIEALLSVPSPELALRLYLQCAEVCKLL
ncbi:hypothetical protein B296_00021456 [Ensete ventricosum]|uniref:Uncharacterized protein n=1 Tax=Ensete ventricosum TaxID=4639 RepID=A0A426Z9Q4_ENSVE|nr:hypothetical protein B296_00021456 [Ensete ventricosum]